ncbi:dTDP-glucose 4,6-dehydratase [Candidatus Poriferisocius sp.]|uniref:dTDP-glucose 4,6-dehydratase n=1 Tax=Candidatus Poriferisocius sp. TaxID=3101276 RepID=UPI003B026CF4
MRLFITGGAGFVGANYARWVMSHSDDDMVVYDALTYAGNRDNLRDLEGDRRLVFVKGDVCDREGVAEAMAGCDAVVHFAAESHVDRSIVSPDAFVRTNCGGVNVVCDTARRLELEKVVCVSTDEVYGSIEAGSFTEADRLAPSSPYSASKAGADLIALAYRKTFGLPVAVTRSSNNFGPYQHPEKVIPLFTTNLLDGLAVPLYGDGQNVRDWCHVEDNCAAIDMVLRQGLPGEVYNIGGGNELANRDLAARLVELCGQDESLIRPVADRLGHDRRYSVDTAKIQRLGWRPVWELDEALAATVSWYRDNRWWWEPLKKALP